MNEFDRKLLNAVLNHDIEEVKEAIAQKCVDVDSVDEFGFSPLYFAVFHNDEEIVKLLLEAGANPNKSSRYFTPLECAINKNNEPIATLLLEAGADVNQSSHFFSLINRCGSRNNMPMVRLLRKYGAKWDLMAIISIFFVNPIKNYFAIPIVNFLKRFFKDLDVEEWTYLMQIAGVHIAGVIPLSLIFGYCFGIIIGGEKFNLLHLFVLWGLSVIGYLVGIFFVKWWFERNKKEE